MKRVVKKYRSSEEFVVDVDDEDCPACEAIREGGCKDGVIFLECDGTVHRCTVTEWSLGERGLVCVTCEIVTVREADEELSWVGVV